MQPYKLSFPGHATNLIKNNKNIHAQGTMKAASAHSEKNIEVLENVWFILQKYKRAWFSNEGITSMCQTLRESVMGWLTTALHGHCSREGIQRCIFL